MDASRETIVDRVPAARKITIQDLFRHTSGLIYGGRGATPVHKLLSGRQRRRRAAMTGAGVPRPARARCRCCTSPARSGTTASVSTCSAWWSSSSAEQSLGQYLQERCGQAARHGRHRLRHPGREGWRATPSALPNDPDTGKPQSMPADDAADQIRMRRRLRCRRPPSDYLRFALMLANKGSYGDKRILGRKTVEYMLSNQLGARREEPDRLNGDPTRADYGFGLGLAVRTTPGIARMMGSVGDFSWPGASGTNWWAIPRRSWWSCSWRTRRDRCAGTTAR